MADFTGYPSPLRFKANLRPGVVHPLDGLPIDMISQLDVVVGSPMITYMDHMTQYQGPLAEGAGGGYLFSGTTGVSVITVPAVEYGVIQMATAGADNDNAVLQQTSFTVNYGTTDLIVAAARLNLSDANDMEFFFGLTETNADFVAALPAHGLFFEKAETATNLDFHVRNGGTSTENTADFTGLVLADATDVILVIRVENGNITPHVWSLATGWVAGTTVLSSDANVPDTTDDMTLHVAIEAGAALAKNTQIDWLMVAKAR